MQWTTEVSAKIELIACTQRVNEDSINCSENMEVDDDNNNKKSLVRVARIQSAVKMQSFALKTTKGQKQNSSGENRLDSEVIVNTDDVKVIVSDASKELDAQVFREKKIAEIIRECEESAA